MGVKYIAEKLLLGIVFFLPWHAILILRPGLLQTTSGTFDGVWQYGVIGITPLDIAVVALMICIGMDIRKNVVHHVSRITLCEWICFTLLIGSALLSMAWAADKQLALFRSVRLVEGVAVFIAFRLFRPRAALVAWSFAAGGAIQGIFAFIQYSQQIVPANAWLGTSAHSAQALGDSVVENRDIRVLRSYGTFPHPNILGLYLGFAWICCLSLISNVSRRTAQWILLVAISIITSGLLLSFSRSAWIALGGALIGWSAAYIISNRRLPRIDMRAGIAPRVIAGIVCLVMIAGMSYALWEPLSIRLGLQGWQRLERASVSERSVLLQSAVNLIPSAWWHGVGIGQFTNTIASQNADAAHKPRAYDYQPVHLLYALVFIELGVFGFLGFVGIYAREIIRSRKSRTALQLLLFLGISALLDHAYWTDQSAVLLWWIGLAISASGRGEES